MLIDEEPILPRQQFDNENYIIGGWRVRRSFSRIARARRERRAAREATRIILESIETNHPSDLDKERW